MINLKSVNDRSLNPNAYHLCSRSGPWSPLRQGLARESGKNPMGGETCTVPFIAS